MIFLDTETCGLHGPIVLIQWARDDGSIHLHNVWTETIDSTLELIEMLCKEDVCAFNLAYDWFHICQLYTTLILLKEEVGGYAYPENYIDNYALCEEKARFGPCLKPKGCLDLMLHARKGPYQSTMNRDDIRIKKVPSAIADELADELNRCIPLKEVYFARKSDPSKRWQVFDIKDDLGNIDPDFKDIVLKFAPSSALKALAQDALNIDDVITFSDIELPKAAMPNELGYAPFALAVGTPENWNGAWPEWIETHITHWGYNKKAREYATKDVEYLQRLYHHFSEPEINDEDSILACMVGAVRWHGFKIDIEGIKKLKEEAISKVKNAKYNFASIDVCRKYLAEVMTETELLAMKVHDKITTKGVILEEVSKWRIGEVCHLCDGLGCSWCENGLEEGEEYHPAATRAREILDFRHATKEVELYDKLLTAGRFHASFNVIGALSDRMSGADGLNPQGIKRAKYVRQCFPLADFGLVLCGGDAVSFEVVLMDAAFKDPDLRSDLLQKRKCSKCNGAGCDDEDCEDGMTTTKIHALFGTYLFPDMSYDDIIVTKGLPGEKDKYTRSKNGVFALAYGGEAYTLVHRVGVQEKVADEAYNKWTRKYKVWGAERRKIFDMFCSIRQPGGIGTRVEWHEPAEYIESMLGFRRYFTLENQVVKVLFRLGENPPKQWLGIPIKVVRREREQTACGATRSALFACAFALQAANMRAAGNHRIQSSGAGIIKQLQCKLWGFQPTGINKWYILPLNIHDELMCPAEPEIIPEIHRTVRQFEKEIQELVPLFAMGWKDKLNSWADK